MWAMDAKDQMSGQMHFYVNTRMKQAAHNSQLEPWQCESPILLKHRRHKDGAVASPDKNSKLCSLCNILVHSSDNLAIREI